MYYIINNNTRDTTRPPLSNKTSTIPQTHRFQPVTATFHIITPRQTTCKYTQINPNRQIPPHQPLSTTPQAIIFQQ